MPLYRQLIATGNWLFRWRSYLPVIMVVSACVAMFPFPNPRHDGQLPDWLEIGSLCISFTGLVIRAFVVGHTPAGTSGRNTVEQVAESLNTTGIYSTVRHPLYLANMLIGLGLACFTLIWWFVVIYVLAFWLYYERIMLAEEAFLKGKFGETFDVWAKRTPAFVPCVSHYIRPKLRFSIRNVLRREYNTLFQIVVVAFLLEVIGDWLEYGRLSTSAPWTTSLCVTTAVWIALRALKRHSSTLDVAGR